MDDNTPLNSDTNSPNEQSIWTDDYKAQYMKEYYILNRAKWFQAFTCDLCGGKYKTCNKSVHMKSKKHRLAHLEKLMMEKTNSS
ncbi:MAG: hypothetical protein Hyperionvirus3_43 [Hyperionvirus sp.]|uniref:Uncharacterized protein n=1 Tax=Hyperionvirus sp. TaxID=2487770 RepID=A0A3G5A6M2_9VIRU|nr:MAG: hypothetical protein Hyperionvirus3_43 [Hyperionvirus sp.]